MPKQELDGDQVYNLALSIVGLVLHDGPATVAELADHFSVSEKAILKAVHTIGNSEDVANFKTHFYLNYDALDDGEIDFGVGEGYLEDAPMLSANQAAALAMGLEFLASLPEFANNSDLSELRGQLSKNSTTLVAASWSVELELLEQLRSAILDRQSIRFRYLNQIGKHSQRQADPLRIDLVGSKHYLRAFCHTNQELRTFRLDRLSDLEITGDLVSKETLEYQVPDEVYGDGGGQQVEIAASKVAEEIFWNFPAETVRTQADGTLVGSIRVGNLQSLARHIARYGGAVQVLSPQAARQAVAAFAQQALEISEPEVE